MKFIVLGLLLSTAAMACPQLSGNWQVCRSTTGATQGSEHLSLTQLDRNGITVYQLSQSSSEQDRHWSGQIIADGRLRYFHHSNDMSDDHTELTAYCEGDTLIKKRLVIEDGWEILSQTSEFTRSGKQMLIKKHGIYFGTAFTDLLVCD